MRALALAIALIVAASLGAEAAPESYTIDPFHTFPQFEVDHLGYSKLRGRFDKTSGKLVVDPVAKTGSLEIVVETASVSTGDSDRGSRQRSRDEHLRSADFFNAAEFPRMTFKSTGVTFSGDRPATVEGQLTLLGVTKPVTLKVDSWRCGPHPVSKRGLCGGNAIGAFKRSDFGMKFGLPTAIGDDVALWVEFEALRDQ